MNTTPNHMKSPTNIDFQSHNDSKIVATSQSLGKAISNAKKARQDAELKSHLLSNRIALLQHEESKIICKINETKKKTYDLYKIKKNNEEWKNLKNSSKNHKDLKTIETQKSSQKYRELHDELRKKLRDSWTNQKQKDALEIRNEKKKNDLRLKELLESTLIENKRSSTKIKAGHFQRKLKLKEFSNNISVKFQQQKLEDIKKDEISVKKKELEMAKMELLEMELIKKLQNTHEVQKNVYIEYDSLLNKSIQDFEKIFKPPMDKKYRSEKENSKNSINKASKHVKNDFHGKQIKYPQALNLASKKNTTEELVESPEKNEESPIKEKTDPYSPE